MNRYSLIVLHNAGNVRTMYDYTTGEYLRHNGLRSSKSGYSWFLIQPFAICGFEILGERLMAYPLPGRLIIGIFAFLTGVIISTVLWELLLKYYGDKTGRESARIGEPPQSVLREWTGDFPGRIKKVYRITGVLAVITAGLVAVFLKTGVAAALTIALCFYCIMYFILSSVRPDLLKRYMKERLTNG